MPGPVPLFVDSFIRPLDRRFRFVVPAPWRRAAGLPERFVVLMAADGPHLIVHPARTFEERLRHLSATSLADEAQRRSLRTLAARAQMVDWDTHGRIRLADSMLQHARIRREVRLIGAVDHFEIRSTDAPWPDPETSERLREAMRAIGL
jgi:division/cell wall cluster transcriptional repressor MraZ